MKKKKVLFLSLGLLLVSCGVTNSSVENPIILRYNNVSIKANEETEGAIDVLVESLNSEDNLYLLLLNHLDKAPTAEQIKNGQNYDDVVPVFHENGVGRIYKTISNLTPSSWYDVYVVSENNSVFGDIYSTKVYTLDSAATQDKGEGTLEDPYRVETIEDLENVASTNETLSAYYVLMADIDLSSSYGENLKSWTPLGYQQGSNKAFQGTFDGNGHTISNLYIDSKSESTGLFGQLGNTGTLVNLNLEDVNVNSTMQRTGALVGYSKGLVSNINVIGGSVKGTRKVGGVVGDIYETGFMYKSYTKLDVIGTADDVGGIVGAIDASSGATDYIELKNCYSASNVSGTKYVGGVIGYARCMLIDGCYSMSNVTGTESSGGLVGQIQRRSESPLTPILQNSFALDTVTTTTTNGGIVIGKISTSNGSVDVKNVYYFNATLESPKENSNSNYVTKISDEWFKNTEETKTWFSNEDNIKLDFRYTWEIKDNALRPTLKNSSKYDEGKRS